MKIKKYLFAVLSLSVLFGGCSAKKENPPVQSSEPEPAEQAEDYSSLTGTYVDSIAGRGMLELKKDGEEPDIYIRWSSSAFQYNEWHMHVRYNNDHTALEYQDCTMTEATADPSGKETKTIVYSNGTGYFELVDQTLVWHDDQSENAEPTIFVRDSAYAESHGMPNPWTETTDPEEAERIAGFPMDCPVDEAMPNDMVFRTFMCMNDVYGAIYDNGKEEMLIRKSSSASPEVLSGDFHSYSKSWDISLKGLTVHCLGDGTTVNNAAFSNNVYNFVILYDAGNEGNGLTPDQLNSLIMSLQ